MTALEFQYELINHQDGLTRFAYHLTSNKDDAQDLVQDTFLKALKSSDKFIYESNLKAWIYTILRNSFINNYRRSVRYSTISYQTKEGFLLFRKHTSAPDDPDSVYASKELEKTIDAIDDKYKVPFKMHVEGFKYKEIAEALNMKMGTVKSRIFLSKKVLKEQLSS